MYLTPGSKVKLKLPITLSHRSFEKDAIFTYSHKEEDVYVFLVKAEDQSSPAFHLNFRCYYFKEDTLDSLFDIVHLENEYNDDERILSEV